MNLSQDRLERGYSGRMVRGGEKKGEDVGITKYGKRSKPVDPVDSPSTSLAINFAAVNESEVNLIESVLDNLLSEDIVYDNPLNDRGANSHPLRHRLQDELGIDPVCPHRRNRN